jgi:uncharacterized protein Yka (UPF0111/DUF47 family)
MDSSRRVVLYHPRYVEGFRAALREARADLAALHFRHLCELQDLRREVDELRSIFEDVVHTLRQQAESDVDQLRRQLMAALVRLQRRDPNTPLH